MKTSEAIAVIEGAKEIAQVTGLELNQVFARIIFYQDDIEAIFKEAIRLYNEFQNADQAARFELRSRRRTTRRRHTRGYD